MTAANRYDTVGDVIRDGIPRDLMVRLTDLERMEMADAKSELEDELVALNTRMAEVRREMTKAADAIARRISDMRAALRDKQQRRVMLCYERWDNGQVEVVRRDLDPRDPASVVDRRPATIEEAQRVLAGVAATTSPPATAEAGGKRKRR